MESTILGMEGGTIELNSNMQYQQSIRITEREVWGAANGLWAKKIDPSSNKVRELLGNRGSFRTIQLYLDTWRRQDIEHPAIDDPLWQEISKMRKKVEQQAKSVANSKIQTIEQECDSKLLEMQELQRLAEHERNTLKQQLQEQQFLTDKLNDEHDGLKEKFYNLEKKLVAVECSNQLLERQLQELKLSHEKQLAALSQDYESRLSLINNQTEDNSKKLQDKVDALENNNIKLKLDFGNQITDLRLKNQELQSKLNQANENEKIHKANEEKFNAVYAESQEKINKLLKEKQKFYELNHQLEKELEISKEKVKHSNNQVEYFTKQCSSAQEQLLNYRECIGVLETKLSLLDSKQEDNNSDVNKAVKKAII